MSTKVKGDKIKEGSIPLSALSDEVKNKIDSPNKKIVWENIQYSPFSISGGATGNCGCTFLKDENNYHYYLVTAYDNYIIQIVKSDSGFTKYHDPLKKGYFILLMSDDAQRPDCQIDIVSTIYDGADYKITIRIKNTEKEWLDNEDVDIISILESTTYSLDKSFIPQLPAIYVESDNPDWNALKGEAGYIENKAIGEVMYAWDRDLWNESIPLSVDDLNNHSINFDSLNVFNEGYRIGFRYVIPLEEDRPEIIDVIHDIKRAGSGIFSDGYVNYNKYSIVGNMKPGDKRYIYDDTNYDSVGEDPHEIQIYYYKEDTSYYLEISMSYPDYEGEEDYETYLEKYIKKFNFAVFCNIEGVRLKQINYDLLPSDVVAKKTENLDQYQKNKILANLGIDPVVWKYMCNPLNIIEGDTIPQDLHNLIYNSKTNTLNPIIINLMMLDDSTILNIDSTQPWCYATLYHSDDPYVYLPDERQFIIKSNM